MDNMNNSQPSTSRDAQNEYLDAINFREDSSLDSIGNNNNQTSSKFKNMVSSFMQNINDSQQIYPIIAITVMVILVIMILFQKTTTVVKIMAVILLIVFVIFTVYRNKK